MLHLSIAKKKDSTGICFIGERDFRAFFDPITYQPHSGPIIDLQSKIILGEHLGVLYYTLGQRKGLNINAHEGPGFVAGKDIVRNELYVVKGEDNPWLMLPVGFGQRSQLVQIHLIAINRLECTAKFRYRQKDQKVKITLLDQNTLLVDYAAPIIAVTPGQEAVFYIGDVCLGGGVIDDVYVDQKGLQERLKAQR